MLPGIFKEIVVSRKGAFSCPVATGVIFAVNVDTHADSSVSEEVYSQRLLTTMQAHAQPSTDPASYYEPVPEKPSEYHAHTRLAGRMCSVANALWLFSRTP